jgi:hypothetical protein
MPCWVAPVVAAELWGVSLEHVITAMADGTLPSQQEYGFTLVDVAPHVAQNQTTRRPNRPPPPTYVVVDEPDAPAPPFPAPLEAPPPPIDESAWSELPPLDEEEDDVPITHWREVRSRVGRSRQPPRRIAPRAA